MIPYQKKKSALGIAPFVSPIARKGDPLKRLGGEVFKRTSSVGVEKSTENLRCGQVGGGGKKNEIFLEGGKVPQSSDWRCFQRKRIPASMTPARGIPFLVKGKSNDLVRGCRPRNTKKSVCPPQG